MERNKFTFCEVSMLMFIKSKGEEILSPRIHGTGTNFTEIGEVAQMTYAHVYDD
jgi:hypothetical protein